MMSLRLACVVLLCLLAAPAAAQQDQWLVLPVAVGPRGEPAASSRHAAQALTRALGGEGGRIHPAKAARTVFEQRGSSAPIMVSHSDLDQLARDAQMALYHVASGLHVRARKDVERALARADKVLESLNREALAAQQLLDACLYLVRSHLQGNNDRLAARTQALECRRLVPDIEPDGTIHPPEVIGILAEAEAKLRQQNPGSLRIESVPPGCTVYVNGRDLGSAPLELAQLSPGEYRLQAECEEGEAGRVHRVTIGGSRVVRRIDTRFDAAVQTGIDLSLRYPDADAQRRHAYGDAVEVGRIVGVAEVLLVLPVVDAPGLVQANRIRVVDGELISAVRLRLDEVSAAPREALRPAARALVDGETRNLAGNVELGQAFAVAKPPRREPSTAPAETAPPPVAAAPSSDPAPDEAAETDSAGDGSWDPPTLGIALAATGVAATLTSWGLFAYQLDLELTYSDQKAMAGDDLSLANATYDDIKDFELVPLATGVAGSALLTASLPLVLPKRPPGDMPWWAIGAGILGGAAAVTGAVMLAEGVHCDDFDHNRHCTNILATTRLGGLLVAHAIPFLATPAIYLLRSAFADSETRVSLIPSKDGLALSLRGKL